MRLKLPKTPNNTQRTVVYHATTGASTLDSYQGIQPALANRSTQDGCPSKSPKRENKDRDKDVNIE